MRIRSLAVKAMVVCGLAASLFSQTPSSNVPGSQTPVAPGQAPPSSSTQPGQTPPQGQGQSQGQGGLRPTGSSLPGGGENQLFIELKVGYNHTEINPAVGVAGAPPSSFLTPGNNEVLDFTLFQDHSWGNNRVQVLGIFRNANDPRIDPENNSFQRGYIRIYNPRTELNLGDYLINYSRFTYNQNIKGVSIVHKVTDTFKVSANGGVFTDRWGSAFKDDLVGQPFTRFVAGFRAEEKLAPNKLIGLNFSEGHDQIGSIRRDLLTGLIGVNNQILSVDSKMDFGRAFSVDGELAYSLTNPNIEAQHVVLGDWGARLDTRYRKGPFFWRTNYTRMEPNFLSVNARQLADLQDVGTNIGTDIGSHATLEGSFRYTENDLRHQRPEGATIFKVPEVKMSFRQVPHLGRTIFDFGYRERRQTGPFLATLLPPPGAGTDKQVRIPYADVSIPFSTTLISVGYEHRFNHDGHDATQNTDTNRVSFSLRSILDWRGWQFSPLMRYEIEREFFLQAVGANNNRNIQGILYVEAPKYILMEFVYKQIGASLFTQCATTTSVQCGSFTSLPAGYNVLVSSGFGRPQYRAAITYKFRNSDNRELIFSVDRNSNYFAIGDPFRRDYSPGRDFDERIFAVTMLWRYKK